jgi:hypothetical protein
MGIPSKRGWDSYGHMEEDSSAIEAKTDPECV